MLSWVRNALSEVFQMKRDFETLTTDGLPAVSSEPPTVPAGCSDFGAPRNADDYLGTPTVAAYFDAREHEAYYQALKRAELRRDFHKRIVSALERFISLTDLPAGAEAVDRVMAESLLIEQQAKAADRGVTMEAARDSYPEGVELLSLTEPLTFDSLKSAYRKAVRRNHPDAGGSHEAMVAVNEAFRLIHALLREREIGAGTASDEGAAKVGTIEVTDCAAYRYKCGELLFLIALDEWNLDASFAWLERITSTPWQQSPYTHDPRRRIALTEPAGKLAARLAMGGLNEQAARSLSFARTGFFDGNNLQYDLFLRGSGDVAGGRKRSQVVISHQRQADNALRLGIIDANRYKKITERLASSEAIEAAHEERLRQFQTCGGFLRNLPVDGVARGKVSHCQLVPEPGYYVTRIEQLTDDQQAEYLDAFSDQTTLPLVRKYTLVRLVSLLESMLFQPSEVDGAVAEQEARILASLHEGSGAWYGLEVAEAIRALRQQPRLERQTRATLLKDIQQGRGRAMSGAATFEITVTGDSPLGMPLTPDYFRVILLGIDALCVMQRTGQLPESKEDRQEQEAWLRDSKALRKPEVEAAQEKAFAAMGIAKSNPESAVQTFSSYCDFLLALGKSMVHVQELQIGFWVDRLTGALVRLGRFGEARDWLDRYFALPPRYRARSGPAEEERLQKRLARCAKALQ